MDHLRGDGGADVDVSRATALVEGLRGDAQGAQLPADAAEKVEEGRVAEVEADRVDGHAGFADQADYAVCPRAVEHFAVGGAERHGAGGEEADGMTVSQAFKGYAYAVYVSGIRCRLVACLGGDGDEVVGHRPNALQHAVDHDAEVGAARGEEVDEDDAVERADGMVGDGDKGAFGQGVEALGVVHTVTDVHHWVGKHGRGEGGAAQVAMFGVDGVDFVDAEPLHQPAADGGSPSATKDGGGLLQVGQAKDGLRFLLLTHAPVVCRG